MPFRETSWPTYPGVCWGGVPPPQEKQEWLLVFAFLLLCQEHFLMCSCSCSPLPVAVCCLLRAPSDQCLGTFPQHFSSVFVLFFSTAGGHVPSAAATATATAAERLNTTPKVFLQFPSTPGGHAPFAAGSGEKH